MEVPKFKLLFLCLEVTISTSAYPVRGIQPEPGGGAPDLDPFRSVRPGGGWLHSDALFHGQAFLIFREGAGSQSFRIRTGAQIRFVVRAQPDRLTLRPTLFRNRRILRLEPGCGIDGRGYRIHLDDQDGRVGRHGSRRGRECCAPGRPFQ